MSSDIEYVDTWDGYAEETHYAWAVTETPGRGLRQRIKAKYPQAEFVKNSGDLDITIVTKSKKTALAAAKYLQSVLDGDNGEDYQLAYGINPQETKTKKNPGWRDYQAMKKKAPKFKSGEATGIWASSKMSSSPYQLTEAGCWIGCCIYQKIPSSLMLTT